MKWNDVTKKLPPIHESVVIWIKWEDSPEFEWTSSWLEDDRYVYDSSYIEPISGKSWAVGSAENYVITHWASVEPPKR